MTTGPTASNPATTYPAVGRHRPVRSREIRVGLVMYGGVSLAVYINGVSREFFNAVRGRGVYGLLKAMTDSDVVVDVISGTSAGGINGILLGYAICNQREFAACADLWRQYGDIARLMRDPGKAGPQTYSLLDSEGYYQPRLAAAFADMGPCGCRTDEDVSPTQELDLFVTGTEIEGRRYTVLDDAGHAVDVKDHRTVFVLKHRAGRRHPFEPAFNVAAGVAAVQDRVTHGALAKLGRITSCFPVAFAPVEVECVPKEALTGMSPVESRIDALLTEWGSLRRDSCFLDGGVLDNKPFTYTVREIFRRTAERAVERRLFYVEPDPEQFSDVENVAQPDVVKAAMLAMIGIPSYESIADDLKLLAERNSKIHTYKRLARHLDLLDRNANSVVQSAAGNSVYQRSRLVALSQLVVRGILRVDGDDQLLDADSQRRAEHLFNEFDRYAEEAGFGADLLQHFDIYFRLRRLFDLVYYCYESGRRDPGLPKLLWVLNRQLKLLDIVRNAMEQLIDELDFDWRRQSADHIWEMVRCAFSRLLTVAGADGPVPAGYGSTSEDEAMQSLLTEVNRRLRVRIDTIKAEFAQGGLNPPSPDATNLLQDADDYERRIITAFNIDRSAWDDAPLARYERFDQLDARLYPLEMFGDINEKDEIRTVRISPIDAQRGFSRREGATKTAGQTLSHFGGFFKRSWRSNDILCGRLDAVAQILEEFFDKDRIAAVASNAAVASSLQALLGDDLDPSRLFPNAGKAAQDTLRDWLTGLVAGSAAVRAPDRFDQNLTLLVEAAQLEILYEDLNKLVADEELELREWDDPNAQNISPISTVVDAERTAARKLVETAPPSGSPPNGPRETAVGRFFASHGSATGGKSVFASVPPMVLLETLAKGLLVARDAIVTAFGDRADAVRRSPGYKWIDRALRLFYGSSVFFRSAPPQAMAAMAALTAVSILALLVGVIWWREIIAPGAFRLRWFLVFIVAPATILATQALLLLSTTTRGRLLSVLAAILFAAIVMAVAWQQGAIVEHLASLLNSLADWLRARR
jgi:patatin-related protein